MTESPSHGFATRAMHAGQEPDPTTGSIIPPIHQTSTFVQDGIGGLRGGYEYAPQRQPHPRGPRGAGRRARGQGADAIAFASGLAAEDALLRAVLKPGDRVVLGNDAYGGTYRLLKRIHEPLGVRLDTVDLTDPAAVEAAFAEPVAAALGRDARRNPLMKVIDIAALAAVGHAARRARGRRQHLRLARPAAAAARSAPTWSCTPPRSTSAATPTCSAASS